MSNAIDLWYDAVLKQMAAEAYLGGVDLSNPGRVKDALVQGNNRPGFEPLGLTRFSDSQADEFLRRFEIVHQWSDNPLSAMVGPDDPGYLSLNGQQILANSGLSATLIKNIDPASAQFGSYTLSIRSTEYQSAANGGDRARDLWGADSGGIFPNGFALAQWNALEQYYDWLKSSGTLPTGAALNLTGYSLSSNLTTLFTETHPEVVSTVNFNGPGRGTWNQSVGDLRAMLEYYRAVLADPLAASAPVGSVDANIVAAYAGARNASGSLDPRNIYEDPRHQWAAFATYRDFGTSFNPLSDPNRTGLTNGADSRITQLYGQAETGDSQYVANSGVHGPAERIFIEDQADISGLAFYDFFKAKGDFGTTHSITLVGDSLALMRLITKLAPSITHQTLRAIFAAASNERGEGFLFTEGTAEGDSLERMVRALGGIFKATPVQMVPIRGVGGFADSTQRNIFFQNLDAISAAVTAISNAPGAFGVASLIGTSASSLTNLAINGDLDAMAYRYALQALNPFAVFGPATLYQPHNQSGQLDLFVNATSTPAGMTNQYLTDRAQMLAFLNTANTNDTTVLDSDQVDRQVLYTDLTKRPVAGSPEGRPTNLLVSRPGSTPDPKGPNIIGFGTDSSDQLRGRDNTDRLYGGQGSDFLEGRAGNDYLEGGAGLDLYAYNATSGGLFGGSNDGNDTILDTDGKGVLRVNISPFFGVPEGSVIADASVKLSDSQWRSADGKVTYTKQANTTGGTDLAVTISGVTGGSISLRDFRDGDFGIRLWEPRTNPAASLFFIGDKENWDSDPTLDGIQVQIDAFGNTRRADGQDGRPDIASPNREDVFYGSQNPATLGDKFTTGGGNDIILADRPFGSADNGLGNADWIVAGAGRDDIDAGPGNDLVESGTDGVYNGEAGGDLVYGGAGDDDLFGDAKIALSTAITQGNTATSVAAKGDAISGGAGEDWIIGGAARDALLGGGERDLIVAGAGDDDIFGDMGDAAAVFAWSVTRDDGSASLNGFVTLDTSAGGADVIYAGRGVDWVFAGAGDDFVDAGPEADVVFGEAGADILIGGDGNDYLIGDNPGVVSAADEGGDYLDGGAGIDTLQGDGGDDILIGGPGNDILIGGAGKDIYVFNKGDGADTVFDVPETSVFMFGDGFDRSQLKVVPGSMLLDFGTGDRVGIASFDHTDPNAAAAFESLNFADGTSLSFADVLEIGFTIEGTSGDDDGHDAAHPVLVGTAFKDHIFGFDGNDELQGREGDDDLDGSFGNDRLFGGDGADTLLGGFGDDALTGNAGNDRLFGGFGDDALWGGTGNDYLDGGGGYDFLIGDQGDDTYVFQRGATVFDYDGAVRIAFAEGITAADLVLTRQIVNNTDRVYMLGLKQDTSAADGHQPGGRFPARFVRIRRRHCSRQCGASSRDLGRPGLCGWRRGQRCARRLCRERFSARRGWGRRAARQRRRRSPGWR